MRTVAFSLCLFLFAPTTPAADSSAPPPAPEKPRDAPVPTKEAAGKMTVPEGFKVTLFAGEPDVVQPIAFTFDDRGRMWVVECLSYPNWSKDGKGKDRVVILEDTDGDGVHDKKTVFLDDGVNLSGIELGFGGVWLCSSPNLVFVPILEGDKPGKPEVKLDGWNMIDTKHNIFNSLGWGPDGWLYGLNGIQAKAWVGPPGTAKDKRKYMDCGVWRYHPTRKEFEPVAHGTTNPFGLDWDEYGEIFITNCVIDHLFHIVPGGHYERMYGQDANPHTYGLMKSCVDYKHWATGDWTSSRSTGVGGKPEHSDAGGGHAHAGCAIYLGENFPAEYRNTLFTANLHGNRLNNDGLERTKSGYKGVRRKDFLFANDSWFRGICVKLGPEGALYVSDWCDTGECHNYDKADTTNGRIYRVSYGDPKQFKGDVSKLTDAELVKLQTSKNEWLVRHARRVLQERAAAGKLEKGWLAPLGGILHGADNLRERLRCLWTLAAMEFLTTADLFPLLKSKDEALRAWAYRLLLDPNRQLTDVQKNDAGEAAENEESAFVRLHIAGASVVAGRAGKADRPSIGWLIGWGEENPQVVLMMWYAIEQAARSRPEYALIALREHTDSALRRNAVRYVIARADTDLAKAIEEILMRLPKQRGPRSELPVQAQIDIVTALREELAGRKDVPNNVGMQMMWRNVFGQIKKETTPEAHRTRLLRAAEALGVTFGDTDAIDTLLKRVSDAKAEADDRRAAIEVLLTRKQPDFAKTLRALLEDPAVRQVAVRGLAAFADAETPAAILKAYPKFTVEEKLDAVQTLASRVAWAKELLDAVEKGTIPRADVPLLTARQILALNDKATTARLETVWGKIGAASKERAALTKKWKETLTDATLAKANPAAGRVLFTKHCATCHKMFGEGQAVGPELTGSQRMNLDYVLENVLDPSAVVPREFQMVNFTTKDERVVSGIVLRETKDAVTVRTTNETVVLPIADVAARKQTNLSIMPEGLFDQMKPDEVRDLVAYLRAKEQIPLPK
jgi:putative membrane-bound dehydrogenase-like protein